MYFNNRQVISLEKTTSTNAYMLELLNDHALPEGSVVTAFSQTQGRGQGHNTWESTPGTNLTFTMVLYPTFVKGCSQFQLSKVMALAVRDFLSQNVANVSVKWPNDIYVGEKKITGMLIENFIEGEYLTKSIIGIGININQEHFHGDALNPVSLYQLTGKKFDLDRCLESVITAIEVRYRMLVENSPLLDSDYLEYMYRFGIQSLFSANDKIFEGTITGVNKSGMLEILTSDQIKRSFGFKEIIFVK